MTTNDSHRTDATLRPEADRLETATGIDRSRPIGFTVDGVAYSGFAGDTIASALIAAGRLDCGPSTYLDRPRGFWPPESRSPTPSSGSMPLMPPR
ncbi:(2Fe-2S)-binding protein [Brevibacterium casei]|nr:(2Fe-2S)-binding protein [Brevibacterium casei]